jgi:hypothetical protein
VSLVEIQGTEIKYPNFQIKDKTQGKLQNLSIHNLKWMGGESSFENVQ